MEEGFGGPNAKENYFIKLNEEFDENLPKDSNSRRLKEFFDYHNIFDYNITEDGVFVPMQSEKADILKKNFSGVGNVYSEKQMGVGSADQNRNKIKNTMSPELYILSNSLWGDSRDIKVKVMVDESKISSVESVLNNLNNRDIPIKSRENFEWNKLDDALIRISGIYNEDLRHIAAHPGVLKIYESKNNYSFDKQKSE